MSPLRYRDDERSTGTTVTAVLVGALAGFAVGVLVSNRIGGWSGLRSRLRAFGGPAEATRHGAEVGEYYDEDEYDVEGDEIEEGDERDEELEDRVLEAFRNDPILCERAVDIGSVGPGIIELAGWVESDEESQHAVTLARGVPGVDTVVNRVTVGAREERFEDAAQRVAEGDPSLTEARWEGMRVGTGRRRQGTSDEPDRHADPAVPLEDRWLREDEAMRNAAEDTGEIAEPRDRSVRRGRRGNRAGGSPPSGAPPKADQVAKPSDETPPI
ncbi:MAG: BON domain-containing protein [Gemmatimonadota bacterium]|nr:BON domain-containing protein [Gemmatimonadota bacterium]